MKLSFKFSLDDARSHRILIAKAEYGEYLNLTISYPIFFLKTCDFAAMDRSVEEGYLKYLRITLIEMKMKRATLKNTKYRVIF